MSIEIRAWEFPVKSGFRILVFCFILLALSNCGYCQTPDQIDPGMAPRGIAPPPNKQAGRNFSGIPQTLNPPQSNDGQFGRGRYGGNQYGQQQIQAQPQPPGYPRFQGHGIQPIPNGAWNPQAGGIGIGIQSDFTTPKLQKIFEVFYREADFEKAGKLLHQSTELNSFEFDFRHFRKMIRFDSELHQRRYRQLQLAAFPKNSSDFIVLFAGYHHYQLGHFDEAEREILRFLKKRNGDPVGIKLLHAIRDERPPAPISLEDLSRESKPKQRKVK